MIRSKIIETLKNISMEEGLAFNVGPKSELSLATDLPLLWMESPRLRAMTGRQEGLASYTVNFYIVTNNYIKDSEGINLTYAELEKAVFRIFLKLNEYEHIKYVSDLEIKVPEQPLTLFDDMSLHVKTDLHINFYMDICS